MKTLNSDSLELLELALVSHFKNVTMTKGKESTDQGFPCREGSKTDAFAGDYGYWLTETANIQ